MLLNSLTLLRIKSKLDRKVLLETSTISFDNGILTASGDGSVIRNQVSEHQTDTSKIVITGNISTIDEHTFENFSNLLTVSIDHSISISNFAFHNCALLESITFSSSVTSLGTNIFDNCQSLKSIEFPGSLSSIPAYTFNNCISLEKVVAETPERVFHIGESAFYGCSNLFTFTALSENVTIGKNAFNGCTILQDFIIGAILSCGDGSFANSGVTQALFKGDDIIIAESVFNNCTSLSVVGFGGIVKEIRSNAFKCCSSLKTIVIDQALQENFQIGESAFYGCSNLQIFHVTANTVNVGTNAFNGCSKLSDFIIGSIIGASPYSFANTGISQVYLKIETIPESMFENCNKLNSVLFSKNILEIQQKSFRNCVSIEEFIIPTNSSLILKNNAFEGCRKLQRFRTQCSVTSVGDFCFDGCITLYDIVIGSVTNCGKFAFRNTEISQVLFKDENMTIYESTFENCLSLSNIILLGTVREIQQFAFKNCWNLPEIIINPCVDHFEIGKYSFFGCWNLRKFHCETDTISFGESCFSGCTNLGDIKIGSIISVGKYSFADTKIVNISFDIDNFEIPEGLFEDCSLLSDVKFNKNVTAIGDFAFMNCINLKSLTIYSPVSEYFKVGKSSFKHCVKLESLRIHAESMDLENSCFYGCENLHDIVIGSVVCVKDYAFSYCAISQVFIKIDDAVIPEGLFYGCHHLNNVVFKSTVKEIKSHSFRECFGLEKLIINSSNFVNIGDSCFQDCVNLKTLLIDAQNISVGKSCFMNCYKLNETKFGIFSNFDEYSFACSSIKSVNLTTVSVRDVPIGLFENCQNLLNLTISGIFSSLSNNVFKNCSSIKEININPTEDFSIGDNCFKDCFSLVSFHCPSNVVKIGCHCFENCTSLSDLILGIITEINEYSFYRARVSRVYIVKLNENIVLPRFCFFGCKSLIEVRISSKQIVVENNCFDGCSKMSDFDIEGEIVSVGFEGFNQCQNLQSISMSSQNIILEEKSFFGCKSLKTVKIMKMEYLEIPKDCFSGCTSLEYFHYNGSIRHVDENAFYLCRSLKSFVCVSTKIVRFGKNCFFGCQNVDFINISCPNVIFEEKCFCGCGVITFNCESIINKISHLSFVNCSRLTKIEFKLSDEINEIPNYCFTNCSMLKSIKIEGNNISKIGKYTLQNSNSLTKASFITSSDNLLLDSFSFYRSGISTFSSNANISLSPYSFLECKILQNVEPLIKKLDIFCFANCSSLNNFIIDEKEVTSIPESAFEGTKSLKYYNMNISTIGYKSFFRSGIKNISITVNNVTIGKMSFAECRDLENVFISSNISNIEQFAFYNDEMLTDFVYCGLNQISSDDVFSGCKNLKNIKVSRHNNQTKISGIDSKESYLCNTDEDNQNDKKRKIVIISTVSSILAVVVIAILITMLCIRNKKKSMPLISSLPLVSNQENNI